MMPAEEEEQQQQQQLKTGQLQVGHLVRGRGSREGCLGSREGCLGSREGCRLRKHPRWRLHLPR